MNVNGTEFDLQIQSVQDGNLDGNISRSGRQGFLEWSVSDNHLRCSNHLSGREASIYAVQRMPIQNTRKPDAQPGCRGYTDRFCGSDNSYLSSCKQSTHCIWMVCSDFRDTM